MSDNGRILAFFNDTSNIVNIFEVKIENDGKISSAKHNSYTLPRLGLTVANL